MYTVKLVSLKLKKKLTRFDKLRFAHEVSPRVKEIKKYESGPILFTEQTGVMSSYIFGCTTVTLVDRTI